MYLRSVVTYYLEVALVVVSTHTVESRSKWSYMCHDHVLIRIQNSYPASCSENRFALLCYAVLHKVLPTLYCGPVLVVLFITL